MVIVKGFARFHSAVTSDPFALLSIETGLLGNRAGREAVRGEVWQARVGQLPRLGLQPAELRGRERGGTHDKRKTGRDWFRHPVIQTCCIRVMEDGRPAA